MQLIYTFTQVWNIVASPRYFDIVVAVFVTTLIMSNILSSAKIIDLGFSLGPVELAFDAGTLLFPISYIFGDILTEIYGYSRSRRVIWIGFGMLLLSGIAIGLADWLPAEVSWEQTVGTGAYRSVLGGFSSLIVASLAAYWIGEFSNSYILARLKILTRGRWVWSRTIASTVVGQLLDTLVFVGLATILGVFTLELAPALIATNYILKVGVEVVLTPLTLVIIANLKRIEGIDHFDYDTHFNPFQFKA
ncbi:MAG: queuosine precursor transporter [Candidatus Flexifilum sp.]